MLVALPSSVAFGILVYSNLGQEYSGRGAMAGLLGAAMLGLVAPFVGRNAGLISAPCAPAAAVLSALIAEIIAGKEGHVDAASILPILAMTTLASALLQIAYGILGGGKLIKFIPYQVVSGYLSGVALIIAMGQIPKLFGFPKGTALMTGLMDPSLWKWPGLVVGTITIAATVLAPKFTKKVPAAICGLLGGVLSYFALSLFEPALLRLEGNPLIIGPIRAEGSIWGQVTAQGRALLDVNWNTLKTVLVPAATLSILLSIDTLKTCVGLDALTRNRHQPNRELIGQGLGNLASFFVGGMPGAGTMGPTLVNVNSGGRTPRAGVIEGIFVLLAFAFLGSFIAWVPIGALAGILLVIAWRMFDRHAFKLLRHPLGRTDFLIIAAVVTVALTVDLIAASGAGIALAIFLFIRDQVHAGVVLHKEPLNRMPSKTRRDETERAILQEHGDQAEICMLQGNLFFGTTDQLYTQLEEEIRTKKFLLLDLRRVRSIDYTAVHLFEQIHSRLKERGGNLMFSGMPSAELAQHQFDKYLEELGLLKDGNGVIVWDTLDEGLVWMEEQILNANGAIRDKGQHRLDLQHFSLFRDFYAATMESLASCVSDRSVEAGTKVFSSEDVSDEVFLVRRGSVRILMPLPAGKYHHLETVSAGGLFGELAFLDRGTRSTDAVATEVTDLYVLSRARFNELSRANAETGVRIFARLAVAIARGIRERDIELRALENR